MIETSRNSYAVNADESESGISLRRITSKNVVPSVSTPSVESFHKNSIFFMEKNVPTLLDQLNHIEQKSEYLAKNKLKLFTLLHSG